ncbi:PREDICTED: venom allergen 5-like [Rhagoletis zephyria]|uniref:venom allergen 5-like n=1 Tax=Rhagoletis zephyria TaxID=28612 RepID=UPI00081170CF|nr:PREDICTED: venom allergen 5-like [Rhagoletis zephyria]
MIELTAKHKRLIVDEHNAKRSLVAGGKTKLEPACRMATMEWDEELASLAALNVKQCQMKHDACHNTKAFRNSGQNLALQMSTHSSSVETLLKKFVNMWYDEIKDVRMSDINHLSSGISKIGHFTVMVVDRNIRVGCAASSFQDRGMINYLFACNYAETNMLNQPVYDSCNDPASKCKTGKNPAYENLCSISEKFNDDQGRRPNSSNRRTYWKHFPGSFENYFYK